MNKHLGNIEATGGSCVCCPSCLEKMGVLPSGPPFCETARHVLASLSAGLRVFTGSEVSKAGLTGVTVNLPLFSVLLVEMACCTNDLHLL